MKTTAINNGAVNYKTNGTVSGAATANGTADAGKENTKINGLPVSKDFTDTPAGPKSAKTILKENVSAGNAAQAANPKAESAEVKEEAKTQAKPALNLEETLLLVAELGKKTALRDKYNGYIDTLKDFVIAQNDDDMASGSANFKSCELVIRDAQGHEFRTDSATVIAGTVNFMSGRFTERLAEVEAEIVIPA